MVTDVFAAEKRRADEQKAEVALPGGLLNLLMPLFTGQDVGVLPALEGEVLAGTELLVEFGEKLARQLAIVMRIGQEVANDALRSGWGRFHEKERGGDVASEHECGWSMV